MKKFLKLAARIYCDIAYIITISIINIIMHMIVLTKNIAADDILQFFGSYNKSNKVVIELP